MENFNTNYLKATVYQDKNPPIVRFEPEQVNYFSELAKLRIKQYASSTRFSNNADAVGLLGEIAYLRFLGVEAEKASNDFTSGLKGDSGCDFQVTDVKSTRSKPGYPLRFTFTKTNRFTHKAIINAFCHLLETQDGGLNAYLLGWSWKKDVNLFLRDSTTNKNLQKVYLNTLERNGLLQPVSSLEQSNINYVKQMEVINQNG